VKSLSQAIVSQSLLDAVSRAAAESPRRRMNRNFHDDNEAPCHRLLNAIEPGSYIQPHCHLDPEKDETFVLLRGKLGVICFTEQGEISETVLLSAGTDQIITTIPHGIFHTAVSLAAGTIFFEAKAGPYLPFQAAEKAAWAPADATDAVASYLHQLCSLFTA